MLQVATRPDAFNYESGYSHPSAAFSLTAAASHMRALVLEQLDEVVKNLPRKVYQGEAEAILLMPLAQLAHRATTGNGLSEPNLVLEEFARRGVVYAVIGESMGMMMSKEIARTLSNDVIKLSPLYQEISRAMQESGDGELVPSEDPKDAVGKTKTKLSGRDSSYSFSPYGNVIMSFLSTKAGGGLSTLSEATQSYLKMLYPQYQPSGFSGEIDVVYDELVSWLGKGKGLPLITRARRQEWLSNVLMIATSIRRLLNRVESQSDEPETSLSYALNGFALFNALKVYLDLLPSVDDVFPHLPPPSYAQAWAASVQTQAETLSRHWLALSYAPYAYQLTLNQLVAQDALQWIGQFIQPEPVQFMELRKRVDSEYTETLNNMPYPIIKEWAKAAFEYQKSALGVELLLPQEWVDDYSSHASYPKEKDDLWDAWSKFPKVKALVSSDIINNSLSAGTANSRALQLFSLPSTRARVERQARPILETWAMDAWQRLLAAVSQVRVSLLVAVPEGDMQLTSGIQTIRPFSVNDAAVARVQAVNHRDLVTPLTFSRPASTHVADTYILVDTSNNSYAKIDLPDSATSRSQVEKAADDLSGSRKSSQPKWNLTPLLYKLMSPKRLRLTTSLDETDSRMVWSSAFMQEVPLSAMAAQVAYGRIPACYTYTRNRSVSGYNIRGLLRSLDGRSQGESGEMLLEKTALWLATYSQDDPVVKGLADAIAGNLIAYIDSRGSVTRVDPGIPTIWGVPRATFLRINGVENPTTKKLDALVAKGSAFSVQATTDTTVYYVLHAAYPAPSPIAYLPYVSPEGYMFPMPISQAVLDGALIGVRAGTDRASANAYSHSTLAGLADTIGGISDAVVEWQIPYGFSPFTSALPHIYFDVWTPRNVLSEAAIRASLMSRLVQRIEPITGALLIRMLPDDSVIMLDTQDWERANAMRDPVIDGTPSVREPNASDDPGLRDTLRPDPSIGPDVAPSSAIPSDAQQTSQMAEGQLPASGLTGDMVRGALGAAQGSGETEGTSGRQAPANPPVISGDASASTDPETPRDPAIGDASTDTEPRDSESTNRSSHPKRRKKSPHAAQTSSEEGDSSSVIDKK